MTQSVDDDACPKHASRASGIGHNGGPPDPDLTEIRQQLFRRGYKILPNKGKIPVPKQWNNTTYLTRELTDSAHPRGRTAREKIDYWIYRFPEAQSTGVRIEDGLRVIDIDVGDRPMVKALLEEIRKLAPDIVDRAPMRFGAPFKVALFCRKPDHEEPKKLFSHKTGELSYVFPTEFIRAASDNYRRPDDAEDVTHKVEIFGGALTPKGNCSRQFGIYGPHSYNDDGSVAREYEWADDRPKLHEIDPGDLPELSREVAYKIVDAFRLLAEAADWTVASPATMLRNSSATRGTAYDIDENTRFDTNQGGSGIDYEALCDEHAIYGDSLRCAATFMPGRGGSGGTDRCWVFMSPRHDCVAVYVYGDDVVHYPKRFESIDTKAFGALLREILTTIDAQQAREEAREEAELERAFEIWKQSRPLRRTAGMRYLRDCGIDVLPRAACEHLQFHDAYPWRGEHVPALVGMLADVTAGSGYPVGVHVTRLSKDGHKLGCEVIGQKQYGVIMLSPIAHIRNELAITVGFERALSATACGIELPIWALPDVESLAEFPVLPCLPVATAFAPQLAGIERLTIITDHDRDAACEAAIAQLRARWEAQGLRLRICRPRQPGWDFNDLKKTRGRE